MSVVWRVRIKGTDINWFVAKHRLAHSSIRDDSFNLLISDSDDISEQKDDTLSFIKETRTALMAVSDLGGISEIDFALFVGAEDQFTQSITFSKNELAAFAESAVELRISAYPCSDE